MSKHAEKATWETLHLKWVQSSRSALIINLIFILIAFEMKPNQGRAWQHWRLFIEISAE